MSVLKTLRETVAPELNHLYTTEPADTPTGLDCGWHGREHALHAFFVARMFHASADIRSGDFAVLSPYLPPLTSVDRPNKHTWCSVNEVAPVDLAMTFGRFGESPQLRGPIIGEGRNGDWDVQYSEDESVLDESFGHTNEIIFIEREVHAHAEQELLRNPQLLLGEPPKEGASWSATYGADIYAKVSLHCHACANRTAKSIRQRLPREQALAWIAENYPDPIPRIVEAMRQS